MIIIQIGLPSADGGDGDDGPDAVQGELSGDLLALIDERRPAGYCWRLAVWRGFALRLPEGGGRVGRFALIH